MTNRSILIALSAAFAVTLSAASASAAPIGTLSVTNCLGGGVTVDIDTIDWVPTVNGGDGCIGTGITTDVDYSGPGPLTLGPGVVGNITDLQVGSVEPPQAEFMDFVGHPNLNFNLAGLGPGVFSNGLACGDLAVGQSCSISAQSPFILTLTFDALNNTFGTSVSLTAFGVATDLAGSTPWSGSFTTQIAGKTPWAVEQEIENGGQIASTHSGAFELNAQPIPEPASLLLFGTGLVGTALRARARRRRES